MQLSQFIQLALLNLHVHGMTQNCYQVQPLYSYSSYC